MFDKITIVSGGDTKYFQLLKELAHSVRDKPEGKDTVSYTHLTLPTSVTV